MKDFWNFLTLHQSLLTIKKLIIWILYKGILMIKNTWLTSLMSLLLLATPSSYLFGLQGGGMPMGQGGLIPQPTEEEMRYIMEEFLPSLSDEELEELAKLGEEMIKAAEKEGIPLWQSPVSQAQTPQKKSAIHPKKAEQQKEKPAKKLSASASTKKILLDLIKVTSSIRQKVSVNAELEDAISSLNKDLNSLVYFIHVLNDDKLMKYLNDPEFSSLYSHVKSLLVDLDNLDNSFYVPSLKVKTTKKQETLYNQDLKRAKTNLHSIINRFNKGFKVERILDEIETLLKKYEPEALETKKELDASEKKASEFLKKIPKTNTNSPFPAYGKNIINRGATPAKPGATKGVTPGSSTKMVQQKNTPQSAPAKKIEPKKIEPKKPASEKKSPTIQGLDGDIIAKLNDFERFLTTNSARISSFLHGYKNNKKEDNVIKPLLQEAKFKMKYLKKDIDSWDTLVDKEAKGNFKATVAYKKRIQFLWNNKHVHSQFKNLISKLDLLIKDKVTLQGELKGFHEITKKIVGKILEI